MLLSCTLQQPTVDVICVCSLVAAVMAMIYHAAVNAHYHHYPPPPLPHYEYYERDHYLVKRSTADMLASLIDRIGE